jgi:hypothetical protein
MTGPVESQSHLGPQFLSHQELGSLRSTDFPGPIGDPDPIGRMEGWQEKFGGTGEARHYEPGDNPTKHVAAIRESVREHGVQEPITVREWRYKDGSRDRTIYDGAHRAVAAHLEGQGAPAKIHVHELPY